MNRNLITSDATSRERKKAKTKLALAAAAAQLIEHKTFDAVSVRELCDMVAVSETTFYNHFPRKSDVVAYCTALWNLEAQLRAWSAAQERAGLRMIGELFEQVARHVQGRPGLTGEIIAHLAKSRDLLGSSELSAVEKQIAFPEFPRLMDFVAEPMEQVFEKHLRCAVETGELPAHTRVEAVASSLVSLFYGAPIAFRHKPLAIGQLYRRQLNLVWLSARGSVRSSPKQPVDAPSLHHRRAET